MSDLKPGEGWREIDVSSEEAAVHAVYQLAEYDEHTGALKRAWVRVPPVPPLPTQPYTVIRVVWTDGDVVDLVFRDGSWHVPGRDRSYGNTEGLRARVRRFEVLAEPRAETAKAVIDRVHGLTGSVTAHLQINAIAREFGVDA